MVEVHILEKKRFKAGITSVNGSVKIDIKINDDYTVQIAKNSYTQCNSDLRRAMALIRQMEKNGTVTNHRCKHFPIKLFNKEYLDDCEAHYIIRMILPENVNDEGIGGSVYKDIFKQYYEKSINNI